MSHATFTSEIEDWLIGHALGDPDITTMFETLCERLHGLGIPLDRASLSWPTLHPLFRSEMVFWRRGTGTQFMQFIHATAREKAWMTSPLHHVMAHGIPHLRRHLTGAGALTDFPVLGEFREQGYTDYLATGSAFRIAEVNEFEGGRTGVVASWATRRESGFTDDDLDALKRIQTVFAVACRAAVQKRVMANLANAYLGHTAGRRVLAGDIRRGDGERIPAVVWYSDLRGSTRLSNSMDPDSYLALLNRYFECTAAPVIEHGGEILNFIGDGVLAIFPVDGECGAAAARAEAAVREARRRRTEAVAAGTPGGAPLSFGIGLAVGEVMFGNIGVPSRLAFSGIGQIVNTVQRIETATKTVGLTVLSDAGFAASAPGEWRSAGEIEIRDFGRRIEVFTLPDEAAEATLAPAALAGKRAG
ncbi:MAG TPA: adenylate/guanylate cyclase domain-containing protein [Paracoccaceae bacterium]|nr:adenylate/guanylate cyclase domain-containing protein [Paracoccaceae bacterium]